MARGNRRAADVAVLDDAGVVRLVGSSARGRSAGGIAVGTRTRALPAGARRAGPGLRVRRAGRVAWIYLVRSGRVRAVAVASRGFASRSAQLRRAAGLLRSARATNEAPRYAPSAAETASGGALLGRSLAGSTNARLNDSLALLCRLQVQ